MDDLIKILHSLAGGKIVAEDTLDNVGLMKRDVVVEKEFEWLRFEVLVMITADLNV
jgi:hypothetical protein